MKTYASNIFARVISNALDKDECGANAAGGGGFQIGNTCAAGGAAAPKVMTPAEYAKSERDKAKKIKQEQADRQTKRMGVYREEQEAARAKQEEARMAAVRDAADAKAKAEEQAAAREAAKPKPAISGQETRRIVQRKAEDTRESLKRDGFKRVGDKVLDVTGAETDGVSPIIEEHTIEEWAHSDGRKALIRLIEDKKTWDHKGDREDAPMRLEVQRSYK